MKLSKSYQSTLDEATEASMTLMSMSGAIKRDYIAIFLACIFAFTAICSTSSESIQSKLVFGIILVMLGFLTVRPLHKSFLRWFTRRQIARLLGTKDPVDAVYSLDESGVSFEKSKQVISFRWDSIANCNETTTHLEILSDPCGMMRIPKRILADDELNTWRSYIQSHMHAEKGEHA